MRFFKIFFIPVFFFSGSSFAGGGDPLSFAESLVELLKPYRTASGLQSDLVKSFYQEYKDATEKSNGSISLYQGRLKIKISEPQESRSLLVVNRKSLWLETPLGEGFPVAVTKLPLETIKKSEGIWSVVIGKGNIAKAFNVSLVSNVKSEIAKYQLVPKGEGSYELSKAELEFNSKNELVKLSYWDQMENRVSYDFKKWQKAKVSEKDFVYAPPKNASVTEL